MISGINFWYDLLGLRKDIFSIYYTFDALSGSSVPSVSGGNGLYSGTVGGATGAFGLNSSSGIFNGFDYVSVNNASNLNSNNWSMFFVYERTGAATGTLFSSLTSPTANSGFEIGINNANKLYFFYNSGAPSYYTFDQILANKNAVSITYSNPYLEFDWYNFNTRRFESENFILRGDLLFFSDQWSIGRGFSGAIDDFCYFNGNISKSNRERLFSGFYTLLDLSSGTSLYVTGYNRFQNGVISGNFKVYTTGYGFYTGTLNYSTSLVDITDSASLNLFGDFTDQCGNSKLLYTYQGYTGALFSNQLLPLTGNLVGLVSSGLSVIEPASITSLEVTGFLESGIPLYTGITGVQVIPNVSITDSCGNVEVAYTYNNLTGTISGVTFLPQTGLVVSWDTSLYQYNSGQFAILDATLSSPRIVDSRRVVPFGFNSLTYLWDFGTGETLEFVAFPDTERVLNTDSAAGFDTVNSAEVLAARYPSGTVNFYLNGQFQHESGKHEIGTVYNSSTVWEGDYYLESNLAYGSGYQISDDGFYDYRSDNVKGWRLVTGAASYPLDIGPANGFNFYLNGQKLYTGDYVLAGNTVTITGNYSALSGILSYVQKYGGETSQTGQKSVTLGRFPKGTAFMFQNGIRYSEFGFVEHSNLDKISGNNIYVAGDVIYNNEGTFWE